MRARALEAGAQLLQRKAPLGELDAYLDGFHFYDGNLQDYPPIDPAADQGQTPGSSDPQR